MRIATWNVHTLYRVGAMNELVKEMGKYKIDMGCKRHSIYILTFTWSPGDHLTKYVNRQIT
jgi:hypothetical protein